MAQRVMSSKSMGLGSKSRRPLRRASQRANNSATRQLFAEADISTASKREVRSVLKLSAANLDDIELETAWNAAVRGDYVTASNRLIRTIKQSDVHPRKRKPKGWTPWRNAILPRRK